MATFNELKAENERLELQLAQAREEAIPLRSENLKLKAQLRFERQENERQLGLRNELQQENAQAREDNKKARALLEHIVELYELEIYPGKTGEVLLPEIRAFLARKG